MDKQNKNNRTSNYDYYVFSALLYNIGVKNEEICLCFHLCGIANLKFGSQKLPEEDGNKIKQQYTDLSNIMISIHIFLDFAFSLSQRSPTL